MASEPATPTAGLDEGALKARKRRNMWLALALLAFTVLMGVGTAIKISQGAGTQPCKPLYWEPVKKQCLDTPVLERPPESDPDDGEPN